jgi:CRISPR/Cas system-associated endonuclease Cas1
VFNTKDEAMRIINRSEKKAETSRNIISREINNQKKTLEARIERRKSMSNKSTKTDNDDFGDLSEDIGGNVNFALNGLKERTAKRVFI